MTSIRLNKFVSDSGYCSRRKADELIASGLVYVGKTKAVIGQKITELDCNNICINGQKVNTSNKKHYFAFYKPKGVITSLSDSQGTGLKKFLPSETRLFPIGRLDKDSEGLLLLTNDGEFAQRLSHPKYKKNKVYHLKFNSKPSLLGKSGILKKFKKGIFHKKILFKVDDVHFIENNLLEISLHEGKSRHIRIIAGKIGLSVQNLKRVKIGKLAIDKLKLKAGQMKKIKIGDIE